MKRFPLLAAVCIAALGALATGAAQAAGLERLYILNCGEGIAGDISRWSPGVNVGQSMPFVDNCYWLFRSMSSTCAHAAFSSTPCESALRSRASESTNASNASD